ncbi:hypothetical protein IV203_023340 [Nitzschia inconspicua]|uniref:Uncharacterized protein n=1 Tax=Nitzschia inconspicua TaxID=303405 RepID=A0A9K3KE84_9STRA|nr:hypothetical protein IV203_023340 [Nitzschia inconspicua]
MRTLSKISNVSLAVATVGTFFCYQSSSHAFVPMMSRSSLESMTRTKPSSLETWHGQSRYPIGSSKVPTQTTMLFATEKGQNIENSSNLSFNPLYGALWATFLAYGIFFSPGEMLDASDTKLIETLIGDPSNANGDINSLFFVVFNALGIMPIVMAQLALPQGSSKGVWAAPFVLGSFGAGFGAFGLYLTLRAPPVESKRKSEASWITANVLESKLFNWIIVILCGTVVASSGILLAVGGDGWSTVWDNYLQLASTSKLVSVSSVDLLILTVSAATLIPRDYSLRGSTDDGKGNAIAAATTLLPVVGAALYCALRPPLPDSDSSSNTDINKENDSTETRRSFFNVGAALLLSSGTVLSTESSPAKAASQEELDKANIVKGYQRLQYLLDNWEKETTVCGMGGDKLERSCERTPLKVMDYLGYKATNDPLFKAEKTLRRLYPLAPASRDVDFIEAVDRYVENADEASGMAYISSWGEANPGGGKDRVELFIERARKNVIVARDSLATVIEILGL